MTTATILIDLPDRQRERVVYDWCMTRTNIDIDDEACGEVMRRFCLDSKRDAVNLALRRLAGEKLTVEEALAMRGTGWDGDLDEMRTSKVLEWP